MIGLKYEKTQISRCTLPAIPLIITSFLVKYNQN